MSQNISPISFIPRFFGAFGQFFKYLGNGDYAARCQLVGTGSRLASEVEPEIRIETKEVIKEIVKEVPALVSASEEGAYQVLQLLQQEARFIDFVQEDIQSYSDEEVGAACRVIHKGCRKVMQQNFTLSSVSDSPENSRIELPVGYDARAYKLEGRVEGSGPFKGTLIHPGWKVTECRLPKLTSTDSLSVLSPAEVEV